MTVDHEDRQRAIHERKRNVIVDAGAGTGKTTLLISRLIHLIAPSDDGQAFRLDRIAAITFTRKAAGELRLRLRLELDRARAGAGSAAEIGNLEDALKRLEEARIGTIHSFCAEILRQRPVEARIPPGFEELDEFQSSALYAHAFDIWIQNALGELSPGLRRVLSRISAVPSTDQGSPLDRLRRSSDR